MVELHGTMSKVTNLQRHTASQEVAKFRCPCCNGIVGLIWGDYPWGYDLEPIDRYQVVCYSKHCNAHFKAAADPMEAVDNMKWTVMLKEGEEVARYGKDSPVGQIIKTRDHGVS